MNEGFNLRKSLIPRIRDKPDDNDMPSKVNEEGLAWKTNIV